MPAILPRCLSLPTACWNVLHKQSFSAPPFRSICFFPSNRSQVSRPSTLSAVLGQEACDATDYGEEPCEVKDDTNKKNRNRNKYKKKSQGWKKCVIEDDCHPIRDHKISSAAWNVMMRLRSNGHEVYVVGGTVRDIILQRRPKDFDVLTSAEPLVVASLFPRAYLLGRSFPIVHVHHDGEVTEVSSFSTNADTTRIPLDAAGSRQAKNKRRTKKIKDTDVQNLEKAGLGSQNSDNTVTWAMARQENACKRDFTVNALLYDPFSRLLFDYVGGLEDCSNGVLRTVKDPRDSFTEDPARILRAIRIASRAGLVIETETAEAMRGLGHLVGHLSHGRLQMELLTMMTHGSSFAALNLLWQFQLLPIMLPHHSLLLAEEEVSEKTQTQRFLFEILRKLDGNKSNAAESIGLVRPIDASVLVFALVAPLIVEEWKAERQKSVKGKKLQADEIRNNYYSTVDTVINRVMLQQQKNPNGPGQPSLTMSAANLLPRQALESARELFKLEVGLRGGEGFGERLDDVCTDDPLYSVSKGKRQKKLRKKVSNLIPGMNRRLSKSDRAALSLLRDPELDWDSLVCISSS